MVLLCHMDNEILLQPLNWNIFMQSAFREPGWVLCSNINSTVLFLMASDMTDVNTEGFQNMVGKYFF